VSAAVEAPRATGARAITRQVALRRVGRAALYLVVVWGALVFSFPFFWMISSSVKPQSEMMLIPPKMIPTSLELENYTRPFGRYPFDTFLYNTTFVTVVGMVAVLASSAIVAFAFARMRFPGRDKLFILMLATLMLPQHVTLIPVYVMYAKLGLVNTFAPLLIPEFLGSPFIIFLMRQYMMTIPLEMDDAARIDGSGWFGLFWRIILPLSGPAIGVAAIYSFTFHWNNFLGPLIYLNRVELFTLPLGMAMLNSRDATDFGGLMAIATLSLIPVLIVFFAAQRYFIQGLVVSGVKG
jgi:multiple sugar transport system permease protein